MVRIDPPERRRCERCGRVERWDGRAWAAAGQVGSPHCIHEWDITASYNPLAGDEPEPGGV